jgi:hypothetical protein
LVSPELGIVFICVIIIVTLFPVLHLQETGVIPTPKNYWLNFESNITFLNGDLSMAIGNNGLDLAKKLNIHGIKNNTIILSSFLGTQTGKIIEYLNFNGQPYTPLIVNRYNVSSVEVSAQNIYSGKYNGWLYLIDGSSYTIPITLSTAPKIFQAFILVVIGVLLSIAFWELFFYANLGSNQRRLNILNQWIDRRQELRNQLSPQLVGADADLQIELLNQKYKQEQWKRTERIDRIKNRYREPSSRVRILSFDVASVIFGIVTALVGLSSNSYVIGLVEISPIDLVTLIGIGLGIGSLKGLVDN